MSANMKVVITIGKKDIELSVDEAKKLKEDLMEFFGEKQVYIPYYPTYPYYPNTYPDTTWYSGTGITPLGCLERT